VPLHEAVEFLKGAVARSMPGGQPATYVFHGGVMHAQSPAILAAYPVPHVLGTFALAADDIEGALARMPSEPEVSAGDGTLILKAGRLRSSIDLLACEMPPGGDADANWEDVPQAFIPALRAALPFVPKEGTWHRSIKLEDGRVLALSNRSACEVAVPGLTVLGYAALPTEAAAYLAKLDEAPSGYRFAAGALSFTWAAAGAWARCQLLSAEWPDVFDRLLSGRAEAPVELTQEWRDAFDDACALGDGDVTVKPGGLYAASQHAQHDAEFLTGVERETLWSIDALKPVFGCAQAWSPDEQKGPAYFCAPGVRGVVMAKR
jgi:hypothetical protein